MLNASRKSQAGFSLAELMIGAVIGLLVLSGVIAMYSTTIGASTDNLQAARLYQELRGSLGVMVTDIRRAGYWAGVPGTNNMTVNPFHLGNNDVTVSDVGAAIGGCITYAYDLDKDTAVGDGTGGLTMEQFGFRLNGNAIQMRTSGNVFSCNDGVWQDVTDVNTDITNLSFVMTESCLNVITELVSCPCATGDPCQHIRQVDITVSGRLVNDAQVQQTLTESVRIRNDKYVQVSP